jgi:drug/metabolite transporter (DMT)-like permease
MSQFILFVVLVAAVLDALQHCLIKGGKDALSMALLVAMLGGLVALPVLAATGLPDAASWPWLAASCTLGSLYWVVLGWAYQRGTLAVVFPVSRGTAVLLTTLGAAVFLAETLSVLQAATVLAVIAGLMVIATNGLSTRLCLATLGPALVVALTISAFTLIDATGARLSGSALAYTAMLYIGNAIGIGIYAALFHRARLAEFGPGMVMPALGISALSLTSYGFILYAMTHAPVALVAALAETSIVFAALFGVFWLREPTRFANMAGVAMVASGVVFLRLAH